MVDKKSGGISQERGVPAPHQAPSPGFQCQEDKSPQLLTAKTSRGLSLWKKLLEPQAVPLKEPHMGLLRLSPSELQHQGGSLKGTGGVLGEAEVSDISVSRGRCPFSEPSHCRATQAGAVSEAPSIWLTMFDLPLRFPQKSTHPIYGPTQMLTVNFPYEWLVLAPASQLPKSSLTSSSRPQ